jgi:alpha-1,6-mannosyltransferase
MPASVDRAAGGRRAIVWLALMALALSVLIASAPSLHKRCGGWVLIGVFAVSAAAACAAARLGGRAAGPGALIVILVGGLVMRAGMLMTEPYLSSDIYRYIWDGRVQAAGINPYRYVPGAPELAWLREGAIFPNINRASYAPTIYPPAAQAIFFILTRLSESVVAMRIALIAMEAAICASLVGLLHRQGAPAARIAIYAWHPLPIWEIAGNGHVDAAMIALLMFGLWLHVTGRPRASGIAVTLGALVKPTAVLALPALWKAPDWRLPLVVAATLVAGYSPYLSVGSGVFGYLGGYLREEGLTTGGGYKLLFLIEGLTGARPWVATVYIILCALLLIGLALAASFRRDRSEATTVCVTTWLLIAFLILSSPHYPWYFLVLVPFLVLKGTATAWVLTVASVLFYNAVPEVGPLPSYEARILAFTLLTFAALAFDAWAYRQRPTAAAIGGTP